jgi:hypothetical protein
MNSSQRTLLAVGFAPLWPGVGLGTSRAMAGVTPLEDGTRMRRGAPNSNSATRRRGAHSPRAIGHVAHENAATTA